MIFGQGRLRDEAVATHVGLNLRRARIRSHAGELGRALHAGLGPVGLIGVGFSLGVLFDRLKPCWRGLHAGAGLGVSLLRLAPLLQAISERLSGLRRQQIFNRRGERSG